MLTNNSEIPSDFANITPSDSALVSLAGLIVGVAGNVTAITRKGTSVLFTCQAGQTIVGDFVQVMSTGTTASNIVGVKA